MILYSSAQNVRQASCLLVPLPLRSLQLVCIWGTSSESSERLLGQNLLQITASTVSNSRLSQSLTNANEIQDTVIGASPL